MVLEEREHVLGRGGRPGLFGQILQRIQVFRCSLLSSQKERQRFQFNPQVEYLPRIVEGQLGHLRSGERSPLYKPMMLEIDQSFADQTLSNAELLGQLGFDDLLTALNLSGNDRLTYESDDTHLLRNRLDFLKCRGHV